MKNFLGTFRITKLAPIIIGLILIAVPSGAQAISLGGLEGPLNEIFQTFNIIMVGLQAVLWPILILIGGLLNNDLLFSGGMQTMLLNIWTAVRDFVNILFVLGLLAVAIANIVGVGKEDLALSKVLPKIAIALIAVNFSFLACKVVLDAVNVGTTAIFSIPMASDALAKYDDPKELEELSYKYCNKINDLENVDASENPYCSKEEAAGSTTEGSEEGGEEEKKGSTMGGVKSKLNKAGIEFFSTFNSRNVAIIMAVELMDIVELDEVKKVDVANLKGLTINVIFSIIFLVIYGAAFVALFAALLVRVVVLWISIALSPLSFLGLAFGQIKNKFGEDDPFFKLFFKHALIPLPVAVILTIGMIMITQLKQMLPGATFSTNPAELGAITSGMSTVQDLIAGLATAAFIWIAAFKAMEGTKADFLVNPIKGAVERFGKGVAKLPLYAPLIPVAGEKPVGIAALGSALGGPERLMQEEQSRFAKIFGDKDEELIKKLEKAQNATEARTTIAEMIHSRGNEVSGKAQQAIAKSLDRYKAKMKDIVIPGNVAANLDDLIKKLKAGELSKQQFADLMAKNPDRLKPPALDITETTKAANKAVSDAQPVKGAAAGLVLTTLDKEKTELEALLKELETKSASKDKDAPKIKTKVESKINTVKQLTASRDALLNSNDISNAVDNNGDFKDQRAAQNVRSQYEKVLAAGKPEEARQVLIKAILEKVPNISQGNAEHLADEIINKTYKNKTPATPPATPNPPAQQPPGATPGAGTNP